MDQVCIPLDRVGGNRLWVTTGPRRSVFVLDRDCCWVWRLRQFGYFDGRDFCLPADFFWEGELGFDLAVLRNGFHSWVFQWTRDSVSFTPSDSRSFRCSDA
jgi:hypothetical protein